MKWETLVINHPIMIRPYTPADLEATVGLFTQTVHTVSSSYYSPEEVEAWAPSAPDLTEWDCFFRQRYTLVMETDGTIVGFGCLSPDGMTIDMLFTHHEHQNEGIGSAMLETLEKEAFQSGNKEVMLTTSATAWLFYQKRGYQYHRSEKKVYGSILFDCQILRKALPMFPEIRRKDRVLRDDLAMHLLETGEYGFLAMNGVNGYGYGIPISYVLAGKCIYFHCATEGFKLESLRQNSRVSFCVVGRTQVIPGQFTTAYESALVFGHIAYDLPEDERYKALDLLVEKYSSGYVDISKRYISKSFHRTNILRLDIEHLTGKCKTLPA